MTATKTANYSDKAIATMTAAYTGDNSKDALGKIATAVGKTVPSVRAKLSQLGVYKPNEKAAPKVNGDNKQVLADKIGKLANLTNAEAEGLAKANKAPLERVLASLTH